MTDVEKLQPLSMRLEEAKRLTSRGMCTISDSANYFALNKDEYDVLYGACLEAYEQLHDENLKLRVFSIVLKQDDEPDAVLTIGRSYAEAAEKYESDGQYEILAIREVTDQYRRLMENDPVAWTDTERRMMAQFIRTINETLF